MAIVFRDFNTVEVDGINAGDIVSVLENYPKRKVEILGACEAFCHAINSARDAAIAEAEAIASVKDGELQAALENKESEHAKAIEAKEAEHANDKEKLASILSELGGEPVVREKLKAEKLARIEAEKQRLAEEEAELKK